MDSTNVYAYISVIALAFCIPPAILVSSFATKTSQRLILGLNVFSPYKK